MNKPAFVHVIDDDAGVRNSLRMLMESASLPVRVYESALEYLDDGPDPGLPGCVVLDLKMPDMDGIELLRRLRAGQCRIPVIVVSGHADIAAAVQSIKLGAVDFLQKPFEPEALLSIVRAAIEASASSHANQSETDGVRKRFDELTSRERELLRLVVSGRSNKQIATDLGISVKTVANHRASLMAKVRAANAADLARLAAVAGVVPL